VRAHKPVRPTQLDERRMTLLLRAVAPIELNEAQPLLELDRISKGLWQLRGDIGVIRKADASFPTDDKTRTRS
jgi:hypothetical protein